MTAPDVRPPSDETPTTGWHRHGLTHIHPDTMSGAVCGPPGKLWPNPTPVLVVDPAETRETIARWLSENGWDAPWIYADELLAALAGGDA